MHTTALSSVVLRKYQNHCVSSSQKDPITSFLSIPPRRACTGLPSNALTFKVGVLDDMQVACLTDIVPLTLVSEGGLDLLDSPIATPSYMSKHLDDKLTPCDKTLSLLDDIPELALASTSTASRDQPVASSTSFAFYRPTSCTLSPHFSTNPEWRHTPCSTASPSPPSISAQVRLPLRLGGHGFSSLDPIVHASYGASLIASAPS